MNDAEEDARLHAMVLERGYAGSRKRCAHAQATLCLCEDSDPEIGPFTFVAYQCDLCGMVLDRDVTQEELYRADLPPVDGDLWNDAIRAAVGGKLEATLAFWQKAIRA